MPIPALAYGLISGHGLWFPINLLAGMVIPGIGGATAAELEQFRWGSLILAIVIHATFSVGFGLLFGVVSPTLPPIPGGPVIAGGRAHATVLDRALPWLHGNHQSSTPGVRELALVHRLPGRLRSGHVDRRYQNRKGSRRTGGSWAETRPASRSRAGREVGRELV